jgi:predicted HTH transcriptional regulator
MIPLKLETLLKGRVVESDRVEYKRGWNPSDVIHTICAYANDFDNTNGGYIVIGICGRRKPTARQCQSSRPTRTEVTSS